MRLNNPALIAFITPALLLAGCSVEKAEEAAVASDAASETQVGPAIGGAVAPGVAFTYNYAFSLPSKAISGVQREHAAACERLGTNRCRVTGMSYEQPTEDEISARLDFLLAPDIANRFGSEGIAAVEKADGKLDNASINGENAGDAILLSQKDSGALQGEIVRIEARLKARGLSNSERVELTRRVESLRDEARGEERVRRDKEASLASTPVSFAYASEGLMAGSGTFSRAAGASWSSATAALSLAALIAGYALPWLLLIGGAVLGWRWLRRNTIKTPAEPSPPSP